MYVAWCGLDSSSRLQPSLQFYFVMFLVYIGLGLVWAWQCYQNLQDLLPIQV